MPQTKTCLIIDDSRVARMILKAQLLEKRPDWQIAEADTADNALTMLQQNPVDCICVDYNMPGMTGGEFLAHKSSHFADTRCVMLTANIQASTAEEAKDHGAIFLHKPVTDAVVEQMLEHFDGDN